LQLARTEVAGCVITELPDDDVKPSTEIFSQEKEEAVTGIQLIDFFFFFSDHVLVLFQALSMSWQHQPFALEQ